MLLRSQKSIAQKIIAADSDYILSLKDNHPTLYQQVKNWFEIALDNRQVYTVPVSQLSALHEQNL
jgi:predicted transposase YbfD/YdcC